MKKKGLVFLKPILILMLVVSMVLPAGTAMASEETDYEESYEEPIEGETETETEDPFPESYYLPIESNEVEGWPQGPQIEAEAAVVMDADTGAFLYSKNMDAREYPASITKIMTALIALENGDLNSRIVFSENAVYNLEEGSSHTGIQPGEEMTLRRALYGLMLVSANDVANGIAEHIAGSNEAFADLMNQKAAELGCLNTHFTNPHGLQNEEHYTSARDMALITQAAMENWMFRRIVRTYSYTCPETNMVDEKRYWINHNNMLPEGEHPYEGCIGVKNGFTSDALNTLVVAARRDGRTLISVILRVNGAEKAYAETAQILDYAFENFKNVTMEYNEAAITRADLLGMNTLGESGVLNQGDLSAKVLEGEEEVLLTIPNSADISEVTGTLGSNLNLEYSYHGWRVGGEQLVVSSMDYTVPTPDKSEIARLESIQVENKTGIEGIIQNVSNTAAKVPEYLTEEVPQWLGAVENAWYDLMDFIYDNDIMAAVVCFILILLLLPFLCVAFVRNRKSQKIRKQRKREREERIKREEDIDRKSVTQIELELREELAKISREQAANKQQETEQKETEQ